MSCGGERYISHNQCYNTGMKTPPLKPVYVQCRIEMIIISLTHSNLHRYVLLLCVCMCLTLHVLG